MRWSVIATTFLRALGASAKADDQLGGMDSSTLPPRFYSQVQKRRAFPLGITSQERRRQYDQLDVDHKGYATVSDLIRALNEAGLRETDSRLGGLVEALQRNNSDRLDYNVR